MTANRLITPSQTVGPFFHPTLLREDATFNDLVPENDDGPTIIVTGVVLDGEGSPVPDAGIEIWQADEEGQYCSPTDENPPVPSSFIGYGRTGADEAGTFQFRTIKPGPVPFDEQQMQAPHISLTIYARGLLNHLVTRIYFDDEPATERDPVLQFVPRDRRHTLIARKVDTVDGTTTYRFNIVLQGDEETVFFNV